MGVLIYIFRKKLLSVLIKMVKRKNNVEKIYIYFVQKESCACFYPYILSYNFISCKYI